MAEPSLICLYQHKILIKLIKLPALDSQQNRQWASNQSFIVLCLEVASISHRKSASSTLTSLVPSPTAVPSTKLALPSSRLFLGRAEPADRASSSGCAATGGGAASAKNSSSCCDSMIRPAALAHRGWKAMKQVLLPPHWMHAPKLCLQTVQVRFFLACESSIGSLSAKTCESTSGIPCTDFWQGVPVVLHLGVRSQGQTGKERLQRTSVHACSFCLEFSPQKLLAMW